MDAIVAAEVPPETEASPPYLDPAQVAKHGRFLCAARRWVEAGANVAPLKPGAKAPAIEGWGARPGTKTGAWLVRDWGLGEGGPLHSSTSPKIPLDRLREWARDYREHGCLIFPATLGATVIDVDDMRVLDAVIKACGDTPYRTISGRAGGGVHLWYSGATSSKNGIVPGVDVKSTGGYVIAPGSIHERTGLEYSASPELHEALERGSLSFPSLRKDWRPALERATAGVVRPARLDLASLADTLRERPKTREIAKRLRAIADGQPLADHGERDSALYACLATLAEHWPHAEADAISALLAPSLTVWEREDEAEGRVDADWHGIALEKWERVAGAQEDRVAELDERDAARRRMAWALIGEDSTAAANVEDGPIVVHKSKTYYMRIGSVWHGPISRDDLSADTLAALRALYTIDCQDFAALLTAHGQPLRDIRYSYTIERTTLERGVLTVRAAPVRDLTPAYSATVERGITLLCGKHASSFRHWVGGLLRQDKPCRALIMSGDKGLGKSMLLDGLARLWLHGKAEMHHVVGRRFNDSVLETSYVVADDSTAPSEQGLSLAMYLRQAVAERSQKFEKKHLDIAKIDGSLRFAIGTNDAMEMVQGAVSHRLNDASVAAFAERLLHIPMQSEGAGWWLHDMLPGETEAERTERLVSGDEIARHALWLMAQPENMKPKGRFWCEAADDTLHTLAMLSSGLRGDILLRLAVEGAPGVKHDGERVLVQTRIFVEGWAIDKPRGLGLRSGGMALKALAQAVDVGQAPPSTTSTIAISLPLVRWYAERCGL
jgi:hypothetical protein